MCLYGYELSESTSPLEAGLEWTLALDKRRDFPGREPLRRQREAGVDRALTGLALLERGIPRPGQALRAEGLEVGVVTSGTHSPVLQRGIAMAYVARGHDDPGKRLELVVRGKAVPAEVVSLPFVPSRVRRKRRRKRRVRDHG